MNINEKKEIDNSIIELRKVLTEAKNSSKEMISEAENKLKQYYEPINLERMCADHIKQSLKGAMDKIISETYKSPLVDIYNNVINSNSSDIRNIFETALKEAIKSDSFKEAVQEQVSKKLAQTMVAQSQSVVDRQVQLLKQDEEFKAKMTLLISDAVKGK